MRRERKIGRDRKKNEGRLGRGAKVSLPFSQSSLSTTLAPRAAFRCSPQSKRLEQAIESVQRKAARFVTGNYDRIASVTGMLQDLT